MPILSATEISHALTRLPGWTVSGQNLVQSFEFADFVGAMRFVNAIAEAAERVGHHPHIDIRYNKVHLSLSSHDSGGITERDTALAAEIARISTSAS
jgi:4a-hydroxytetrahydrobiopterin dehydratase